MPHRSSSLVLLVLAALTLAANPADAQIVNGSFENVGLAPWTNFGAGVIVTSLADATFPTDGVKYLTIIGATPGPSTPHSNEGGAGTDASGTTGAQLQFTVGNGSNTTLEFDALFLKGDLVNVDFTEASISDGTTVYNILHLDTTDTGVGPPSLTTFPTTLKTSVAVDLAVLFPTATGQTTFTLKFHLGNAVNNSGLSRAYYDNVRLTPGLGLESDFAKFVDLGATHQIHLHTVQPNREFFHLISGNVTGPVGGGPFVGLYFDPLIFSIIEQPVGTPVFHTYTDANGDYFFNLPTFALPSGLTLDHMIVVFQFDQVESLSSVERYVWP